MPWLAASTMVEDVLRRWASRSVGTPIDLEANPSQIGITHGMVLLWSSITWQGGYPYHLLLKYQKEIKGDPEKKIAAESGYSRFNSHQQR